MFCRLGIKMDDLLGDKIYQYYVSFIAHVCGSSYFVTVISFWFLN
jgi:hypothetical protein